MWGPRARRRVDAGEGSGKRVGIGPPRPAARTARGAQTGPRAVGDYSSDVVVVRDAQEQALDQAREAQERMEGDFLDWAVADFSGYVAADELYDGPFCILSVVDKPTVCPSKDSASMLSYQ